MKTAKLGRQITEKEVDAAPDLQTVVTPQVENIFGFWMQTLADIEILDLELRGLVSSHSIDTLGKTVTFSGDNEEFPGCAANGGAHLWGSP